ncbi:MAG: lysyl oxidase family protein [Actinomycetota bacterium]|nr:lysyl oxidase family protein [Actinomycetota bacterium]
MPGWRTAGRAVAATLAAVAAAAVAALAAGSAAGQYPGTPPAERPNPCLAPETQELLRCPDLRMATPRDLFVNDGRKKLLHATNNIQSRGEGPLEVRGTRTSRRYMSVRQAIETASEGAELFDTDARLVFYRIPRQGPYWKFHEAAEFSLWSLDEAGTRITEVRRGPKLSYCFRDLKRTDPSSDSPRRQVYPACSQDPKIRRRTLGTSVGWSDIYPAGYHQNWINVSGLSGCYEFVHTADPDNYIFEDDETNNEGSRRVRLPASGGKVRGC